MLFTKFGEWRLVQQRIKRRSKNVFFGAHKTFSQSIMVGNRRCTEIELSYSVTSVYPEVWIDETELNSLTTFSACYLTTDAVWFTLCVWAPKGLKLCLEIN